MTVHANKTRRISVAIVLVIISLIGVGSLYKGFTTFTRGAGSSDWPTTQGVIVSSEIQSISRTRESTRRQRKKFGVRRVKRYTVYRPLVTYRYTVNGQTYTQRNLDVNGSSEYRKQSSVQAVIEKYAPGREVTVYYNPNDPSDAMLEPGSDGTSVLLFFVLGVFMLGVAGIIAVKEKSTLVG